LPSLQARCSQSYAGSAKCSVPAAVPQIGFSAASVSRKVNVPKLRHNHTWPQGWGSRSKQTSLPITSNSIGRKRAASALTGISDTKHTASPENEFRESKRNYRDPKRVKRMVLPMSPPVTPSKTIDQNRIMPDTTSTPPTATSCSLPLSPPKSPIPRPVSKADIVEDEVTSRSDVETVTPQNSATSHTPDRPFFRNGPAEKLSS